jgi:hypothetical protein
MSWFAVAFVYPLLLAVLCTGTGLVVEWASGARLPAALIPVSGFAAALILTQFTVLIPAVAPASPWILAVVAVAGYVLRRAALRERWVSRRSGWWLAPGAAALCYLVVAAPLIAAGHLTFPGYLLDTTAGFHLSAGEWMLHHGAPLPPPYHAYGAMLQGYYGHGYPSGGQVLLAVTGWLSGQDLLWLYFPFQVFALALSALALTFLAASAGLSRLAAAFTGWIAAVPALVTAYAQMGSIKELTAMPVLLLMGAAVVRAREEAELGPRGVVTFALAGGGAIAAIGPSAVAWIGVFAIGGLVVAAPVFLRATRSQRGVRAPAWRTLAPIAGALVVLLVVFSIPTLTRIGPSLSTALSFSGSNAVAANDPGNLLRPLLWVQAFGVWLGTSHRVDPRYLNETYALIGIAVLAAGLGVIWLFRRRRWSVLIFLAAALIVWFVLTRRGTEWTNAKVLMLTSPVVMLVVLVGAFGDLRAHRLQGILLAAVIGIGVLASDAELYHGTNMAPQARFDELLSIGQRFSGRGPTLIPDFDEYTLYALRKLNIDSPGFAAGMRSSFTLVAGTPGYGHSYDLDEIQSPDVQRFRLIVTRRGPRWSRPPGNYRLLWEGNYYDVWRRVGPPPLVHMPAGAGLQPMGTLSCGRIRSVAARAIATRRELRYGSRPRNVMLNLGAADKSPDAVLVADLEGFPAVTFIGPGALTGKVSIPVSTTYGLWLGGNLDRAMDVFVDGRLVGAPSDQSGDDGNFIRVASVRLSAGTHSIELLRTGGGPAPGNDSGNLIDGVFLQRVGPEQETVMTISPRSWRSLCGRSIDWLEIA